MYTEKACRQEREPGRGMGGGEAHRQAFYLSVTAQDDGRP